MKVYVKIAMLFLAFTCIFALVACKGTDEKRKQTQPLKIVKTNKIILLKKRKSLKQNQIMKDQQNQRQIQARKIQ